MINYADVEKSPFLGTIEQVITTHATLFGGIS
jgi:hypothetical protein